MEINLFIVKQRGIILKALRNLSLSLVDIVGEEYINKVCSASSFLTGKDMKTLKEISEEKVDFFSDEFKQRIDTMLEYSGKKVIAGMINSNPGAGSSAFNTAFKSDSSPLSGLGFLRLGESGLVYITGKSEHYHLSLGHNFPGYRLIENAKKIGITNATHNNTRGHITRQCEQEIVRVANGISKNDKNTLDEVLKSKDPSVLNRVINLETGSLAVETALKMMLARHFKQSSNHEVPVYAERIPVFLVLADKLGGKLANYHGTTILTQLMRDLWPDFYSALEKNDIMKIVGVQINDIDDFKQKVSEFDNGKYKIAGFFHEIVLMNYAGILLSSQFINESHKICVERDIPIAVDEIQSCMWTPNLFLFKEYDAKPSFVSVGKGFPGGEYPASKILTTSAMDSLDLFGALVTNGQEELASLAYLITMNFVEANAEYINLIGKYFQDSLQQLVKQYPVMVTKIEGYGLLAGIQLSSVEVTKLFAACLSEEFNLDISTQMNKGGCPPTVLMKLPLISSEKLIDTIISDMVEVLGRVK